MAPESLQKKLYSTKSDVWSYGVVAWEVLNRQVPYPGMDAFTVGVQVLYQGLRLDLPDEQEWPVLRAVMNRCFQTDPQDRPDFGEIHLELKLEN